MKAKRPLLMLAAVTAIGIGAFATVGAASATSGHGDDRLVAAIATKFNLNQADVQKVFDEQRQQSEADRTRHVSERLQRLVDNGTITAEQKVMIEMKLTELRAQRTADKATWKTLSAEERKAQKEERKAALEAWAQENNLDLSKLKGIFRSETHIHHNHHAEVN